MASICTGTGFRDRLLDWEFIKAFVCVYGDTVGLLVTGLVVYGAVAIGFYIRTGSVVIPVILFLVVGGTLMAQVAGVITPIVTIAVLGTGAGVMTYLYVKFA